MLEVAVWAAEGSVVAVAEAAMRAAEWAAELKLQARDIHREIPVWPGRE